MKIKIGKILEAKGLQGKLKVFFLSGDPSWAKDLKYIYMGPQQEKKRITSIKPMPDKQRYEVGIEGVSDRNASEALKGQELFIEEEFFKSKANSDSVYLREMLHFEVRDKDQHLGQIIGFDSNGAQDLIEIKKVSGEVVLVPLIKVFIVKVDMKEKIIFMDLPEGF